MAARGVQKWNDRVKATDILPVAWDRDNSSAEDSTPFCLTIKTIEGLIPKGGKGVECRVNVSLFDLTYKQFFGKTWAGPPIQSKATGQKTRLNYNQNVYFHSSLTEPSIIAVVEITAVSQTDDGKKQHVSCGWGVLPIFKTEDDMPDTSHGKPPHTRRVEIYHGSPRSLLYLDEPIEGNPSLTIINGCQLLFTMATHKNLHKAMHLIPENALCGNNDIIPGVDEQKSMVHGKNVLDKPRALRSLPCYIEKISVNLNPTIEKFEEELCKQLNEDRINREDRVADGSTISIQERRLQIAVHNGLTYVHEPEVVHLSAESGEKVKKGSLRRNNHSPAAAARGHQRTNSTSSLGSSVTALVHKNRVELEGMLEDPLFTVVFVMEYLLGEPMAERDRRASMAKSSTFRVAIRWAAWSPINNLRDAEHTINLLGGPSTIPDKSFVYRQTSDGTGSSASLAGIGNGTITFSFSRVDRKDRENIPPTIPHLSLPQESARPGSPGSEGSGALTEIQVTGRPPVPSRPGTAFSQYGGYLTPHGQAGIPIGMPTSLNQSFARESSMGFIMSSYNQQSVRHHIPVEIQHISDGQMPMQSERGPAAALDLQELPFTPVHAPIMASAPGMHKSQTLSRSAYAKLYTAGFPQIVDRRGEPPDVVDPVDKMNFIVAKEEADRLQANEVILQFLAYSRMLSFDSGGGSVKQPATVFFTFQFYRFPQVTTERLLLGNVEGELSADPKSLPCLLQKLEKDGSAMKGPPGYQVKYHIDPAYLKPGEGRLFVEHMACQTLHIDVWDGDSLLLIGSCAVELKNLCRQGREAVQVTHELDIISTEYVEGDSVIPSGDLSRDGGIRPVEVNTILKGRLHLRVANVGHPADPSLSRTDRMALQLRPKNMVSMDGEAGGAFAGGSLHAVNSHQRAIKKACKAMHMVEANHELATALFSKKHKEKFNEEERASAEADHRKRKLARMEAVRQAEGAEPQLPIRTFRQEKEERASDLKTIEMYRNMNKKEGILNMLNQAITVEHTVHPSMGTAEFFEFKLRNPYNTEHTIIIEVSDPELRIITDTREWRYYKMLNNLTSPVEEGMFNLETKSERPEIFLRPKEAVNVPFVFVTFRADHTVQPQAPTDPSRPVSKKTVPGNKKDDPMESRLVKVIFKTQNHKPVSVLAVKVEPQPHIVDQTFRFHHPEQSFLKKSIRLPPLHTLPGVPVGGQVHNQIIVRCSDPNVICESRKVQQGEPHDVFIKVACGSSATTKRFFVAVYQDKYLAKPIQIWQFYVHALQRVDVACIEGQTSRFTLILRGTQSSRLVQAFSSHAAEMEIEPKEPFMLAANALQELHVGVRPLTPGGKFLYLNVVDIEYHQLVRTWLVCVSCRTPIISKAYELMLPVGGGKGSNKRIAYTNPYPVAKTFQLRTNRDDLLQFKDTHLEIGAGETQNIGLRFAPTQAPGTVEILVFINDEDDKNEETFCVRASYS